MKAGPIAQVTDTIPGKIFRTLSTENLVSRFEAAERLADQDKKLTEMERIRDESYNIAHSVWSWSPFYLSSKKFQSAYAIHCGARKAANAIINDTPELGKERQRLDISLGFRFWEAARLADEDARLRGQTIQWREKPGTKVISSLRALEFFTKTFSFTGDRKSIESLRNEWPVLRRGILTGPIRKLAKDSAQLQTSPNAVLNKETTAKKLNL